MKRFSAGVQQGGICRGDTILGVGYKVLTVDRTVISFTFYALPFAAAWGGGGKYICASGCSGCLNIP